MRRSFLSAALRVLLAGFVPTLQAQPVWWTDYATGIFEAGSPPHDYSPANLGQLKHVATQANLYFDTALAPGGESGLAVDAACQFTDTSNFSPLNLGQLKNVAKPFYDRLAQIHFNWQTGASGVASPLYPWTVTVGPENAAPANLGQLKYVFSFEMSSSFLNADTDGDGLPDWYEYGTFNDLTTASALTDWDGDGWNDLFEFRVLTDPFNLTSVPDENGDADGDGLLNHWEKVLGLNPIIAQSTGAFAPRDGDLDTDVDGVPNKDDAEPYSRIVAWRRVPENRYVVVPLPIPAEVGVTRAYDLNNAGQAVGLGVDAAKPYLRVPIVWTAGVPSLPPAESSDPAGYFSLNANNVLVSSPVRWFTADPSPNATSGSLPRTRTIFIREDGTIVAGGRLEMSDQGAAWSPLPGASEIVGLSWDNLSTAPTIIGKNPSYSAVGEPSPWGYHSVRSPLPLAVDASSRDILERSFPGLGYEMERYVSPYTTVPQTYSNGDLVVQQLTGRSSDGYIVGYGWVEPWDDDVAALWTSASASPVFFSGHLGKITAVARITNAPVSHHAAVGSGEQLPFVAGPNHPIILSDPAPNSWQAAYHLYPPAPHAPAPAEKTFINARGEILWSGFATTGDPNPVPILWRNGRANTVQSQLSTTGWTVDSVSALNDNGVILASVHTGAASSVPALLVPIELRNVRDLADAADDVMIAPKQNSADTNIDSVAWIDNHTSSPDAVPRMPQLQLSMPGLPSGMKINSKLEVNYVRAYVGQQAQDLVKIPANGALRETAGNTWHLYSDADWIAATATGFFGGNATLTYQVAQANGSIVVPDHTFSFRVAGQNPVDSRCKTYIVGQSGTQSGSPWFAYAIAKHESTLYGGEATYYPFAPVTPNRASYNQFRALGGGQNGKRVLGSEGIPLHVRFEVSGPGGFGMFQVTGSPTDETAVIPRDQIWNWQSNVNAFLAIVNHTDKSGLAGRLYLDIQNDSAAHLAAFNANPPPSISIGSTTFSSDDAIWITAYNGWGGPAKNRYVFDPNLPAGLVLGPNNPRTKRWYFNPPLNPNEFYIRKIQRQLE